MSKLNNISSAIFRVNASETADNNQKRADIVAGGRVLMYEHARKGEEAIARAMNNSISIEQKLTGAQYKELNDKFQAEHMLYAAKKACEFTGESCPENFEDFKREARRFYRNENFLRVLQGIYAEVVNPILPAIYSDAVDIFADVKPLGFAETYTLTITSDDIPVFQDSAWGAARSVPRNRFYSKDYTLIPKPRTAQINAKWLQLVGNDVDFGQFFANLTAGMYAKTVGLWNQALTAAASDTTLIPTGLTGTFSQTNWMTIAQKLAAVNNTSITNLIGYGSALALSKVLPKDVTGSTNVNMDAAIATLLGADFVKSGYLGEYMAVRLMPLQNAVVPNTQHGNVTTILDDNKVWMMAGNGRKPMTIAMDAATPITIEMEPIEASDFEIGINMTIALDTLAVFASKVGLVTV